ncbi:hypothetical protein ROM51_21615 [Cronobacter sakazakii]|uniref:hypothetical protein n=1 Tax=Cronobacter sakazakii TaxID=28141 RepID=UPI00289476BB|nr:hypothetical protein [Cronobacter sakazakii]MDT3612012.1 hypothetical protein [Cronobacter sakazakii]MDT3641156.1 hypothetical protein [Cronobacter sakazakii]
MNNDELIAAGHELAKCLDSNTPLLDIAKLLSKMATQLDVTTAALREKMKQCEQLAAENAAQREFIATCFHAAGDGGDMDGADIQELGERLGLFGRETYQPVIHGYICGHEPGEDSVYVMNKTPATDAFLREVRASAVDAVCLKISNSIVSCRQDEMIGLDEAVNIASDFAVELRQGGAA